MSIDLKKGQTINLKKSDGVNENNLSKITIGLGWDINEKNSNSAYDLDACALLLKNDKLVSNDDIVYYGKQKHNSGKVWSNGDNLTGAGDGDDEQIVAMLDSVPSEYNKIIFYVTIYQGKNRGQQLSDVKNAFIRAVDNNGKEMLKYNMTGEQSMQGHNSYVFAEVVRNDNSWDFTAIGEAFKTDSYSQIAESYKTEATERKKLFGLF